MQTKAHPQRVLAGLAVAALSVAALPWALRAVVPRPPLLEGIPFSQAVYAEDGTLLRLTLADDERYRVHTRLVDVPDAAVEALLLQEDRWFRWHPGINPVALFKAALEGVTGGRRRGASTLTMQLARMRFGLNTRSVGGKLVQMARALQLELHHSKDALLEAYINLAPYGGNVEGLGAASVVYLGKQPRQLTLPEVLALTVVPQHPAQRSPTGGDARASALGRARLRLFNRWLESHPQDESARSVVELTSLWRRPRDLPFEAPHFTGQVLRDRPHATHLKTTLSLPHQRLVERALAQHIRAGAQHSLDNAAVLLVDTRDMSVRAMVGSADFLDVGIQGQVDGTLARRSPGSALKPFIYALAAEHGLLHPMTLLKDAPARFAGYTPDNFDGTFMGPLSAQDALTRSRNVPAVDLLNRLGPARMHTLLRDAGVRELRGVDHYGLGLALGAVEVTLRELVGLYAMLANNGVHRALRLDPDAPVEPEPTRLLSAPAARITLNMLKATARPRAYQGLRDARGHVEVAFKTGTSNGTRDAWAVGVVGPYALGVWQGNFDGSGNPALIGISAAAPLFFRVVDALRTAEPEALVHTPVGPVPEGVTSVQVCSVSGALPGPHCPHRVASAFIPGVSPIHTCGLHQQIGLTARGRRACDPSTAVKHEVMEFWPSDLLALFEQAGLPRRTPPPFEQGCALASSGGRGQPPRITSPQTRTLYVTRTVAEGRQDVPLLATTDADARTLHWFADDVYLGVVPRAQVMLWRAGPGRHVLRVVDDLGRFGESDVEVALLE
jgi:penicillin-binding protein 1C